MGPDQGPGLHCLRLFQGSTPLAIALLAVGPLNFVLPRLAAEGARAGRLLRHDEQLCRTHEAQRTSRARVPKEESRECGDRCRLARLSLGPTCFAAENPVDRRGGRPAAFDAGGIRLGSRRSRQPSAAAPRAEAGSARARAGRGGLGAAADPVNHTGDLTTIFGANSPEWLEGFNSQEAPFGSAAANLATTDFVGIAVHCANTGQASARQHQRKADPLPDEPGGYTASRRCSARSTSTRRSPAAAVRERPQRQTRSRTVWPARLPGLRQHAGGDDARLRRADAGGRHPGHVRLYLGVHDNHAGGGAYGPGEAGYVAALKSYDDAFGKFFDRLAADGINTSNTLFVVTADENDHFAGQQAQNCDGVNTPCTYNTAPGGKPEHGIFDVTNNGQGAITWTGPTTWPPAGANGPLVGEMGYNMP